MFILIVIGEKGNLSQQAARACAPSAARTINHMQPHEIAELAIYGYDDDSREIWNIPEARDYFITFFEEMTKYKVVLERVLPQTLMTVRACYAARAGKTVVTTGTVEDTMREGIEQALHHRRSHLH